LRFVVIAASASFILVCHSPGAHLSIQCKYVFVAAFASIKTFAGAKEFINPTGTPPNSNN
jgi:hypothetical protein